MECISIHYKNADAALRGQISFTVSEQKQFLQEILQNKKVTGCVLLSTCNRTEVYFEGGRTAEEMLERLCLAKHAPFCAVKSAARMYHDRGALLHLHKVAAGLDSMILGEDEVLGQLKEAYRTACAAGGADSLFHIYFQNAIGCAKKIKTDTELSRLPVSVGTLTANLAAAFGGRTVLLIGISGKTGGIVAKNLLSRKDRDFRLLATVREHPDGLRANYERVEMIPYAERYRALKEADIVISATASPHFTLLYERAAAEGLLEGPDRKRLFVDLAVPADIDGELGKLPGARLYGIDYFEALARENNEKKREAARQGTLLLEEAVEEVMKKADLHRFRDKLPQLKALALSGDFTKKLFALKEELDAAQFHELLAGLDKML